MLIKHFFLKANTNKQNFFKERERIKETIFGKQEILEYNLW